MDKMISLLDRFNLINATYALIIFLVGWSAINWFKRRLPKALGKMPLEETLKPFLNGLIVMGLKGLLLIAVIQKIGIETTSIVAVIGAASLAIGLAFQGTLSNFASGVMLLTLRPFRSGDFIEAAGFAGTVEGVQIFNTTLVTSDNKVAIIPNSMLFNGTILNYSIKDTRRLDMPITVTFRTDLNQVRTLLLELCDQNDAILTDPSPLLVATGNGPNGINLTLRFWVASEHYWPVQYTLTESIKATFSEHGIEIPYPHLTVLTPK